MVDETYEHGLDEPPVEADSDEDIPDENDELRAEQSEARERRCDERCRQNVENAPKDRETDALERGNTEYHRDEAPENG
ncbi:hypothetical protein [Halovivax cerinus]|uniref:Uncharacterized protein n=1 Tax=Halovivax cerinus TaxID=1487865 RepID=A0ABD5NJZ4_9EURY|nr:hypothetical protein [Halovivax cerinus]